MTLSLSHCFLVVHDYEAALGFYRDVLGFEVRNDETFGANRWLTLGSPDQPDCAVRDPSGNMVRFSERSRPAVSR